MLISIVVPVYNVEKYLNRCIDSIIKQTYSNWELYLIDDGSTDNSGVICDSYVEAHDNIQCIHQLNRGLSSARNKGIELAGGDYVLFIDPDDRISENMLEIMIKNGHEADLIVCDTYDVYPEKGGVIATARRSWRKELPFDADKYYDIFCKTTTVWNKLIKNAIVEKHRFNSNMTFAEDSEFIARILPDVQKAVVIPEPFYYYSRNRKGSAMSSKLNDKTIVELNYQISIYQELVRQGKPGCGVWRVVAAIFDVFRKIDDKNDEYSKKVIKQCGIIMRKTRWYHRLCYILDRKLDASIKTKLLLSSIAMSPYTVFTVLRYRQII